MDFDSALSKKPDKNGCQTLSAPVVEELGVLAKPYNKMVDFIVEISCK